MDQKTWSYSRLSALSMCSMKYRLQYIEGWKPANRGLNLVRGSIVHEIAQKILSNVEHFRTIDNIRKSLEFSAAPDELEKIDDKYCGDIIKAGELLSLKTKEIVMGIFKEYVLPLVEENIKFEIKKRNGHFGGLMTTYLDTHFTKENKHIIVEFKTSGRTPSGSEATWSNKKQAIIYNEALNFMYGKYAERIDYWIIYAVILSKEIKILPMKIDFSDFTFYDDVMSEVWNQVRMANELEETGGFIRVLSDSTCGWCQYKDLCLEGKTEGYYLKEKSEVTP